AADLMAVLLARYLRYDFDRPDNPHNDHLIFSKGHASPLLYSIYKAAGAISDEELLTFRRLGSRLEGHPTPVLPWVDVATGSLGQGLAVAVGLALAGKRLDRLPYRVWVLCGDSELAEGSLWAAFDHASHERLAHQVRWRDRGSDAKGLRGGAPGAGGRARRRRRPRRRGLELDLLRDLPRGPPRSLLRDVHRRAADDRRRRRDAAAGLAAVLLDL